MVIDEHYTNPRLAALFDVDCPWGEDKDFYLSLPKSKPISILDIGCGTGQLSEAYAAVGHDVMAIDPASTMLAVARGKPHERFIEWQLATAQTFKTTRKFDLIVMTGHVFQTLLCDEDVVQAFQRIAEHLKPDCQFVFESRNPEIDWFARWSAHTLIGREFVGISNKRARKIWEMNYVLPEGTLVSRSELRFSSQSAILQQLAGAGLRVQHFFGDWNSSPFDQNSSEEMIFETSLYHRHPPSPKTSADGAPS
jgi:2-polyprenyl-3-methyl-5-hydroxy-6-metoxy-1,4-benzoquinol methylase